MGSASSKPARKLGNQVSQTVSRAAPQTASNVAQNVSRTAAVAADSAAKTVENASEPTSSATWAPSGSTRREQESRRQQHQTSEHKSADIMRDAYDPQFLANLSRLGQVKVPKNATNYEPTDQMLRILQARERANLDNIENFPPQETSSSSSTTPSSFITTTMSANRSNRISAHTITLLLDDRKHCESEADLKKLAVEYDLPLETIESLAKYYNSPTMGEEYRDDETDHQDQSHNQDQKAPPRVRAVWVEPNIRSSSTSASHR